MQLESSVQHLLHMDWSPEEYFDFAILGEDAMMIVFLHFGIT